MGLCSAIGAKFKKSKFGLREFAKSKLVAELRGRNFRRRRFGAMAAKGRRLAFLRGKIEL